MKGFVTFLAIVGVVVALTLGTGLAMALDTSHRMATTCDDRFKAIDSSNKGYINYGEFRAAFDGVGTRSGRPAGPSEAGKYYSVFTAMNTTGDGMVTERQFCAYETGHY
jgi:hypothetical protein